MQSWHKVPFLTSFPQSLHFRASGGVVNIRLPCLTNLRICVADMPVRSLTSVILARGKFLKYSTTIFKSSFSLTVQSGQILVFFSGAKTLPHLMQLTIAINTTPFK